MSKKSKEADSPIAALTDETARLRWEIFHRAIAHAKRTNDAELDDQGGSPSEPAATSPKLSIVR